jgi:hypothetical protein
MAAPDVAAPDRVTRTALREFRLSLVLLAGGVVLVNVVVLFDSWVASSAVYPPTLWPGVFLYIAGAAGGILILLAGTVAYNHWTFLRKRRDVR